MTYENKLIPSGRNNPCPICSRSKDGDCRIGPNTIFCHYGTSISPPGGLKPGNVVNDWTYTGDTSDGRCAIFKFDKLPTSQGLHPSFFPPSSKRKPEVRPLPSRISLAQLPEPSPEPPAHLIDGTKLIYGKHQWVIHKQKSFFAHFIDGQGNIHSGSGPLPWPMYRQQDVIDYAKSRWIVEVEGEKCVQWVMAGGHVGVSQPGHNQRNCDITRRYIELKVIGVAGVVFVSDNDSAGEKKAQKCAHCAEQVGLPFLHIKATTAWGDDLPVGGSIDDAGGTAEERITHLLAAIDAALSEPSSEDSNNSDDLEQSLTATLEYYAEKVLALPLEHRLHSLRKHAKDLGVVLNSRDLDKLIKAARGRRDGTAKKRHGARTLEVKATPWLWEGLLIGQAINIIGALPKVGKTSLLIHAIAAWHHGAHSFIGQPFVDVCPPVVIIGTDQPSADWARMLQAAQLHPGSDQDGIKTPVREIWTMEDGFFLDEQGMEICADVARDFPGALFIIDSVAAVVTNPLGIPEESPDIAEPIRRFQGVVGPYGGTSVFIAHSSKGRAGDDPTLSLRGSTALPAVASQILGLARMSEADNEERLILQTQGRGGHPVKLLLSRDHQGSFFSEGDAASVMFSQRLQEAEGKLTDEQAEVLELLRRRHQSGLDTAAKDLAVDNNRNALDRSRNLLKGLRRHGLAKSQMTSTGSGRCELWYPINDPTKGSRVDHSHPSDHSLLSINGGSERSEGSEGCVRGQVSESQLDLLHRCATQQLIGSKG